MASAKGEPETKGFDSVQIVMEESEKALRGFV
jgi:hypothetical protein